MATTIAADGLRVSALTLAGPDRVERALGWVALAMLALVVAALVRGAMADDFAGLARRIPLLVLVHILTIAVALVLTPAILWRRRGDRRHRRLGWVWAGAMVLTAFLSLFIRVTNNGGFSPIHILSVATLLLVPRSIIMARRHDWVRHRQAMRGIVIGALGIAGIFTLLPQRLLGHWLLG